MRIFLTVRLVAYFSLQLLVLGVYNRLTRWAAIRGKDELYWWFGEHGFVEWTQFSLLLGSSVLCWGAFWQGGAVFRILALATLFAAVREIHHLLQGIFFGNVDKILFANITLATVWVAWRGREELAASIPGLLRRPGFYFMFFGLALVTVYAQVLGDHDTWASLVAIAPIPANESGRAWRFVEEGLELMGYLLIAIGVLEERLGGPSAHFPPDRAIPKDGRQGHAVPS